MAKDTKAYLQRLKEQQEKLKARIQAAEAREKVQARKQDTRRKILLGSYYLEQAIKNGSMDELKIIMDNYLKRDSDRLLFNLPSKEKSNE